MTVENSNNRDRLTADGVLTDFDFTFKIFNNTEVLVYLIDTDDVATLQTITTHYTVAINTTTEGGTITFVTPPTDQYEVLMVRNLPYTQGADIPVNEGFSEVTIENALDKLAMQIQQLKDLLDKAVQFPSTSTITDIELPTPEDGKALVWSGVSGTIVNSVIDVGDFDAALTAAQAAQAAAETAETNAETAETNAETAQTAAEAAQAAAEAAAATFDQTKIIAGDTEVTTDATADNVIIKTGGVERGRFNSSGFQVEGAGTFIGSFSTDGTLSGNSDDAVPTEKATKTYVDTEVAALDVTNIEVLTASQTWTAPAGVNQVIATLIGAGGGGGAGDSGDWSGGGGGAGATIRNYVLAVTPSTGYTVTVGSGGSGGTAPQGNGTDGGSSSIVGDDITLTVNGGVKGTGGVQPGPAGSGGTGAIGTVDDQAMTAIKALFDATAQNIAHTVFSYPGGDGGNAAQNQSGAGGSSLFGKGGAGRIVAGSANNGEIGAGGSGGYGSGDNGGDGGDGLVILKYKR